MAHQRSRKPFFAPLKGRHTEQVNIRASFWSLNERIGQKRPPNSSPRTDSSYQKLGVLFLGLCSFRPTHLQHHEAHTRSPRNRPHESPKAVPRAPSEPPPEPSSPLLRRNRPQNRPMHQPRTLPRSRPRLPAKNVGKVVYNHPLRKRFEFKISGTLSLLLHPGAQSFQLLLGSWKSRIFPALMQKIPFKTTK